MAKNMALRRAAKANRRKMIVAQKRKSEAAAATLSEQVRRAAGFPVQFCLITEELLERGSGVVILARGATTDQLAVGLFLLDSFCAGIKNVIFASIGGLEFGAMLDSLEAQVALESVEPSFARKLMRDLARWAGEIGFAAIKDYVVVERLFGDISADACEKTFQFGREGKPFYVQSLGDSPVEALRRLEMVRNYIRTSDTSESVAAISFIPVKAA
jgi:hypothetical protein